MQLQRMQVKEWLETLIATRLRMVMFLLTAAQRYFPASDLLPATAALLEEAAVVEAFRAGVDGVEHMIVTELMWVLGVVVDGIEETPEKTGIID